MASMSFSISRATKDDIPILAQISALGFENDANTQVKQAGRKPGWLLDSMMQGCQESLEAMEPQVPRRARTTFLKAVDNETGQIVGHITWAEPGFNADTPATSQRATSPQEAQEGGHHAGRSSRPAVEEKQAGESEAATAEARKNIPGAERISDLERLTDADMQAWMQHIMPEGNQCMIICGITVHPDYQRRGIGRELVRWGTERADERGVICWVHLSEAGWKMFEKLGWEVARSLTVNLDEYAVAPPKGDGDSGWGTYTFRYAVRQPTKRT
jgi:GNAT superfamily N-acetyltransferase